MDAEWQVGGGLVLTGGVAFIDSELDDDYCGIADPVTSKPITVCPAGVDSGIPDIGIFQGPQARKGTELPVSPKFKGNVTARYEFPVGNFDAHVQGAYVYAGKRWADLREVEREIIGRLDAYSIVDFTAGIDNGTYSFELSSATRSTSARRSRASRSAPSNLRRGDVRRDESAAHLRPALRAKVLDSKAEQGMDRRLAQASRLFNARYFDGSTSA